MFAWSHSDIVGISSNIISHALNIDPKFPPKQQKRRPMDDERKKALKEESTDSEKISSSRRPTIQNGS